MCFLAHHTSPHKDNSGVGGTESVRHGSIQVEGVLPRGVPAGRAGAATKARLLHPDLLLSELLHELRTCLFGTISYRLGLNYTDIHVAGPFESSKRVCLGHERGDRFCGQ